LECIIRRVFRSTLDHDCMLLCPVDMYSTNCNSLISH
jgi:hypothetical protein